MCRWWMFLVLVPLSGSAPALEKVENYRISPNDLLEIKVYQEPDLDTKVRVNADGKIAVPLLGEISVAGKTVSEAINAISGGYRNGYLANPGVSIDVAEYAPRQVTIIGQVQKPNVYNLPRGQILTLLEAIGMAGGYTRIANPSKIMIKRKERASEVVFKVDAKKIASGSEKTIEIKHGDVIQVAESIF